MSVLEPAYALTRTNPERLVAAHIKSLDPIIDKAVLLGKGSELAILKAIEAASSRAYPYGAVLIFAETSNRIVGEAVLGRIGRKLVVLVSDQTIETSAHPETTLAIHEHGPCVDLRH